MKIINVPTQISYEDLLDLIVKTRRYAYYTHYLLICVDQTIAKDWIPLLAIEGFTMSFLGKNLADIQWELK